MIDIQHLLDTITQDFSYNYNDNKSNNEVNNKLKLKLILPPTLEVKGVSHLIKC
jgi:hypothetical protein